MEHVTVLRYLTRTFQAAPLILAAILGAMLAMGIQGGLFSLPLVIVACSWFFKYAFMLLDHIAEGRAGAPVLTPEAANPLGEMRPIGYLLAIAVFYGATEALAKLVGAQAASMIRLIGILSLPAIVGAHVVTGSFAQAINPVATAVMMRRMGASYLIVLCIAFACWAIGRIIVVDGGNLSFMARIAFLMLLWLAMFSVLGGAIYERRYAIGFEPVESPERRCERDDNERDRLRDKFIDRVFGEYRAGAYLNAWESIQQYVRANQNPLADYAWIYERIAGWPNARLANRAAQELLPLLLAAKRTGEAVKMIKERLQADAEFRPTTSEQLIKLVYLARDGGDRPLARALLHDFDRWYPNDVARNSAMKLLEQLAR